MNKRSIPGLVNRLSLQMHILAFSTQFTRDVMYACTHASQPPAQRSRSGSSLIICNPFHACSGFATVGKLSFHSLLSQDPKSWDKCWKDEVKFKRKRKKKKADMAGNSGTRGDTSPQRRQGVGAGSRCRERHRASHPFVLPPRSAEVPIPGFSSWSDAGRVQLLPRQRQAQSAPCQDGNHSARAALETCPGCNHSAFAGKQPHGTECHSWPSHRLVKLILSEVILTN